MVVHFGGTGVGTGVLVATACVGALVAGALVAAVVGVNCTAVDVELFEVVLLAAALAMTITATMTMITNSHMGIPAILRLQNDGFFGGSGGVG